HAGGRRLEDLRELRGEHEVLERLGLEAVPDAGTVGDWLRRQGRAGAEGMQRVNRQLAAEGLRQEPEEVILDVDATEIEAEKQEIQNLSETAWTPYRTPDDITTDRQIAETVHTMNGTEQAFRLVVLRWRNPQPNLFEAERYCYHAVATNREEPAPEVVWKHNQRGNCENWHKELKIGLAMEQMPCGEFEANAMYFAIGVLAYNLAQLLKRRVLPESYRTATVATLRWKVYRLAGKLGPPARGWGV